MREAISFVRRHPFLVGFLTLAVLNLFRSIYAFRPWLVFGPQWQAPPPRVVLEWLFLTMVGACLIAMAFAMFWFLTAMIRLVDRWVVIIRRRTALELVLLDQQVDAEVAAMVGSSAGRRAAGSRIGGGSTATRTRRAATGTPAQESAPATAQASAQGAAQGTATMTAPDTVNLRKATPDEPAGVGVLNEPEQNDPPGLTVDPAHHVLVAIPAPVVEVIQVVAPCSQVSLQANVSVGVRDGLSAVQAVERVLGPCDLPALLAPPPPPRLQVPQQLLEPFQRLESLKVLTAARRPGPAPKDANR